jgi:hypothetical protein
MGERKVEISLIDCELFDEFQSEGTEIIRPIDG